MVILLTQNLKLKTQNHKSKIKTVNFVDYFCSFEF